MDSEIAEHFMKVVGTKIPHGWLVIDRNFKIVYVNDTFCKWWQRPRNEIIGYSLLDLLYDGCTKSPSGHYYGPLIETMDTGNEFREKEAYLRYTGDHKSMWFSVDTFAIRDKDGKLQYTFGSYTAIDRYKAVEKKLEDINIGIIKSFCRAVGARDAYTLSHAENVADYAIGLAEYMNFGTEEILRIYLAGLVHDIGKIGVPEAVLNKPGKLTNEEFDIMKRHPVIAAEILAEIGGLADITRGVRHHHERYDGTGYPDGLAGDNIPLISRLLAICDAYDAMTSVRCYRIPFNADRALAEISACAGRQFDPEIARYFLEYAGKMAGRSVG